MRKNPFVKFSAYILPLAFLILGCAGEKSNEIEIMTLNIRCETPGDGINSWTNRAPVAAVFINKSRPALLGMQEVTWNQYRYLDSALSGYESVMPCGPEGFKKGIANPVFYLRSEFKPAGSGLFWLSATPGVEGSTGWGAAYPRTAIWVKLVQKTTGDTILFINSHFDHKSDSARINEVSVLRQELGKIASGNDFIITGDFNASPESPAVKMMLDDTLIKNSFLISETRPAGPYDTFNGWSQAPGKGRIDYIMVRSGMMVKSCRTLKVIKDSIFISDHWPVTAIVRVAGI